MFSEDCLPIFGRTHLFYFFFSHVFLFLQAKSLSIKTTEVNESKRLDEARKTIPGIGDLPCITSSDAHFPKDIGRVWTEFDLAAHSLEEIRLALLAENDRRIVV